MANCTKTTLFTADQVADLKALLENPPAPPTPINIKGVAALLQALSPQIKSLSRAGYTAEQISTFFVQKNVTVSVRSITQELNRQRKAPGKAAARVSRVKRIPSAVEPVV